MFKVHKCKYLSNTNLLYIDELYETFENHSLSSTYLVIERRVRKHFICSSVKALGVVHSGQTTLVELINKVIMSFL